MEMEDTGKNEQDSVKSSSSEGSQMEREDAGKYERDTTKSSSSEDSPRRSFGKETNENEHVIEGESEQEGSDHKADEASALDFEKLRENSHSENGDLVEENGNMSNPGNEGLVEEKGNMSEPEIHDSVSVISSKAERESGSDAGSPNKVSPSRKVSTEGKKKRRSKKKEVRRSSQGIGHVEDHTGSASENLEESSNGPDKANVRGQSDSDAEGPKHMMHAAESDHDTHKGSCSVSENASRSDLATEIVERGSALDSSSLNEESLAAADVHAKDKDSDSDSEKWDKSSHPAEEVEGGVDPDSEEPVPITKDVYVEVKEAGPVKEEEVAEAKETDPVFDGTEVPEAEARRAPAGRSFDLMPDSPSEKASTLTSLVKMKGAFAVTNVLRRFSGGKEEPDEEEKNVIMEGPEQQVMKGRIIVYTRLGCEESKEIRSFMHHQGLSFVEINVDIYPGRKLELERNTGSSAVPRVYFNDLLVGGLSELNALSGSGELIKHIHTVMNEEPSPEAPFPPISGEDDVSASGKVDELASIVRKMKESINISDRFQTLRRYTNCFVGSEAVDFLSQDQDVDREEAVNLGRKISKAYFFRHVTDTEIVFEDGSNLYRFLEHDPVISTNTFNMTRGLIELKPKRVTEIASRLRFLSFAIFEAYVSEDGRHVNYKSIHGSEEFQRYLRTIEELQRVDLDTMSREEKLAFFINLYNMMVIHAIVTWGYPSGNMDRKKFLGEFKYLVGGNPYSLSAIQNGILRGNQRPPYNISKPFGPKDLRFKVALPYVEPLIHFALVCGSRSCPPLRCYSPGNIDMELMEAARNFLRNGGLQLEVESKTASASSIIRWYSADFGKNDTEVMKHLSNYLEPEKLQQLLDLIADNQLRVTYQTHDWGLNC